MKRRRRPVSRRTSTWFYQRGTRLYQAGRYRKAARSFAKSIRREPGYPAAHAGRGLALARLRRSQRAVRNLERAMALAAERGQRGTSIWLGQTAYESGRTYERLGQLYMALRCYTKALSLLPDDQDPVRSEILRCRGRARLRAKQSRGALDDLNQAIALAPHDASAYYNRAYAQEAVGDTPAAIADLQTYLSLAHPADPRSKDAHQHLSHLVD